MSLFDKMSSFEGFESSWKRLYAQGAITLVVGLFLGLVSALNHNIMVFNVQGYSMLPLSGMYLLILGCIECMDSFLSKNQRDTTQYLHVGVLDGVIGLLIILSTSHDVSRLVMMLAAFLITRGLVRVIYVFSLKLPNKTSTALCGAISIILGFMLSIGWSEPAAWFISMCLGIEIAFRGWAGISFALWVKHHKQSTNAQLFPDDEHSVIS